MSVKKYAVLSRINHDNVDYEIGSVVELEDDQAAPLLKVNVIAAEELIESEELVEAEELVEKAPAPEGEAVKTKSGKVKVNSDDANGLAASATTETAA